MGCDIHLKLEWRYKKPTKKLVQRAEYDDDGNKIEDEIFFTEDDRWRPSEITSRGKEWNERVYGMFAVLSDVRNYWNMEHIPIRGFPEDASEDTKLRYAYCKIFDTQEEADAYEKNGYDTGITKEEAEKYIKGGNYQYVYVNGEKRLSGLDWHSPNWCTTEEMEKCIKDVFYDNDSKEWSGHPTEWLGLLGAMKAYESDKDIECRAVFWFDN